MLAPTLASGLTEWPSCTHAQACYRRARHRAALSMHPRGARCPRIHSGRVARSPTWHTSRAVTRHARPRVVLEPWANVRGRTRTAFGRVFRAFNVRGKIWMIE